MDDDIGVKLSLPKLFKGKGDSYWWKYFFLKILFQYIISGRRPEGEKFKFWMPQLEVLGGANLPIGHWLLSIKKCEKVA